MLRQSHLHRVQKQLCSQILLLPEIAILQEDWAKSTCGQGLRGGSHAAYNFAK